MQLSKKLKNTVKSILNTTVNLYFCLVIDCKINQINFVPLATNWFSARGEGGDYQNIATSILRLLLDYSSEL